MDLRPPPSTVPRHTGTSLPTALAALQLLLTLALVGFVWWRTTPRVEAPHGERLRTVAGKLQAAGALEEAATLYSDYLANNDVPVATRARVAYGLGKLYIDAGQYQHALRWLYDAETLDPVGDNPEVGKKIVHVLERLGRTHAAKAALAAHVTLGEDVKHAADDPVVATIGDTDVYASAIQRALDDLPPDLAKSFAGSQKEAFLRKYVADILTLRKAEKLEYDRDPELLRRIEALRRQLVVGLFVEKEVRAKISLSETDVENYFAANKERYREAGSDKTPTFSQVHAAVERDYRARKEQEAYQALINQELAGDAVHLYPERLQPKHPSPEAPKTPANLRRPAA